MQQREEAKVLFPFVVCFCVNFSLFSSSSSPSRAPTSCTFLPARRFVTAHRVEIVVGINPVACVHRAGSKGDV